MCVKILPSFFNSLFKKMTTHIFLHLHIRIELLVCMARNRERVTERERVIEDERKKMGER